MNLYPLQRLADKARDYAYGRRHVYERTFLPGERFTLSHVDVCFNASTQSKVRLIIYQHRVGRLKSVDLTLSASDYQGTLLIPILPNGSAVMVRCACDQRVSVIMDEVLRPDWASDARDETVTAGGWKIDQRELAIRASLYGIGAPGVLCLHRTASGSAIPLARLEMREALKSSEEKLDKLARSSMADDEKQETEPISLDQKA